MNLDVESLIMFFKKNTKSSDKEEFTEQDAASSAGSSTGGSGKTPRKWSWGGKDGPARGYLDDPKHVWTTGIARTKSPLDY